MHLQGKHLQNPSPLTPHILILLSPNTTVYTKDKQVRLEVALKH